MNIKQVLKLSGAALLTAAAINVAFDSITNKEPAQQQAKAEVVDTREAYQQVADQYAGKIERSCIKAIKSGLNFPRTFEYSNMTVNPSMLKGAVTMVNAQFSAKNAFGVATNGRAVCHVNANGDLVNAKML